MAMRKGVRRMINPDIAVSIISFWDKIIGFIPNIIAAFIIVIIGWIVAMILGNFVNQILAVLGVDKIAISSGFKEKFEKSGVKLNFAKFGGELVKWVIILLALVGASEAVKLTQVAQFLNRILDYIPNLVIALIILSVGILIADFVSQAAKGSIKAMGMRASEFLGTMSKWVIIIFAVLLALDQLGVALEFIKILFTGIVAMLAIAGGLAFGLGGKGLAEEILGEIKKDVNK